MWYNLVLNNDSECKFWFEYFVKSKIKSINLIRNENLSNIFEFLINIKLFKLKSYISIFKEASDVKFEAK